MRKDTTIAVMVAGVTVVYVLGMVLWPYMPKDNNILNKLYYITTSSVLYFLSLIINVVATTRLVQIVSFGAMGVFSVNLYVELFLDPTNWTKWSLGLLIFVPLNMLLMGILIHKIKNNK